MRLIYFPEKEIEKVKEALSTIGKYHMVSIATEYGKYKKGDFVKTAWGEKLVVINQTPITNIDHFKKEYIHYPEIKDTANLQEIEHLFKFKKIEIIELKKYK